MEGTNSINRYQVYSLTVVFPLPLFPLWVATFNVNIINAILLIAKYVYVELGSDTFRCLPWSKIQDWFVLVLYVWILLFPFLTYEINFQNDCIIVLITLRNISSIHNINIILYCYWVIMIYTPHSILYLVQRGFEGNEYPITTYSLRKEWLDWQIFNNLKIDRFREHIDMNIDNCFEDWFDPVKTFDYTLYWFSLLKKFSKIYWYEISILQLSLC